jgi:hypothetical protein
MTPPASAQVGSENLVLFAPNEAETPEPSAPVPQPPSKTMSLLELDASLCVLMDSAVEAAAENNGEIPLELQEALLNYCEAFGEKVDNIARYIRSQEFEATNAKDEIERLEKRKGAAENRVKRLKGLLMFFMESRNLRAMKGALNTITLRKNSQDSLMVNDISHLPAEFWRVSLVLNLVDWQEILSYLPPDHVFRERFEKLEAVQCEPDHVSIRAA